MNPKTVSKLFGLGLALAILALAVASCGQVTRSSCTVTLKPDQYIKAAIIDASPGDVLCLTAGTWEDVFITITKSLTLRGMTRGQTTIKGRVTVESDAEVKIESLTVAGGVRISGSATVILNNSTVLGGVMTRGSANVAIKDSIIEDSIHGITVGEKSQVTIINSIIRNNDGWGVVAWLRKCGNPSDEFTGSVTFQGNNQIYGNGRGDVCLP